MVVRSDQRRFPPRRRPQPGGAHDRPLPSPHAALLRAAAAAGNRAFTAAVMRETPTAAAAEPRREKTEFGTFDVHPDATETLPIASSEAGAVWPVREALFARLRASMEAIAAASAGVIIAGELETSRRIPFRTAVLLDLAWLQTQPVGAELLEAIVASPKNLFIVPGPNSARPPDADEESFVGPDGKPGAGTHMKVKYDPGLHTLPGEPAEAWMQRPPAIGLAHELVHAWAGMTGIRARDQLEEQAVGLGEFRDAVFTENRFRAAFKLPLRPTV